MADQKGSGKADWRNPLKAIWRPPVTWRRVLRTTYHEIEENHVRNHLPAKSGDITFAPLKNTEESASHQLEEGRPIKQEYKSTNTRREAKEEKKHETKTQAGHSASGTHVFRLPLRLSHTCGSSLQYIQYLGHSL